MKLQQGMLSFGRVFFCIVLLICVFETARLWGLSPESMAAHFNAQGNPDSFVPKVQFFWFQGQTALVVLGLGIVLQVLLLVMPARLINLPHREYWLSEEHRDATVDTMSSFAAWLFGCVLVVIQVGFELAVYANLQQPVAFAAPIMLTAIVAFMLVAMLLLFQLTRAFRQPPAE